MTKLALSLPYIFIEPFKLSLEINLFQAQFIFNLDENHFYSRLNWAESVLATGQVPPMKLALHSYASTASLAV